VAIIFILLLLVIMFSLMVGLVRAPRWFIAYSKRLLMWRQRDEVFDAVYTHTLPAGEGKALLAHIENVLRERERTDLIQAFIYEHHLR